MRNTPMRQHRRSGEGRNPEKQPCLYFLPTTRPSLRRRPEPRNTSLPLLPSHHPSVTPAKAGAQKHIPVSTSFPPPVRHSGEGRSPETHPCLYFLPTTRPSLRRRPEPRNTSLSLLPSHHPSVTPAKARAHLPARRHSGKCRSPSTSTRPSFRRRPEPRNTTLPLPPRQQAKRYFYAPLHRRSGEGRNPEKQSCLYLLGSKRNGTLYLRYHLNGAVYMRN